MAANRTAPNLPLIAVTLFFSVWFATFSYGNKFQFLSSLNAFAWDSFSPEWIKLYLMLAGCVLVIWPIQKLNTIKWSALVVLSMIMILMDATRFPVLANHSMMMVLLLVGFLLASMHHLVRGQWRLSVMHTDYVPLMRAFLVVMYFWGTFHKINTDFLHPDGCWAVFFNHIPLIPELVKTPPIGLYLAGYGTLVLETAALLLLLFPRTKYWGMLLGLFFHFLIGITATGNVAHFSAFAFALHFSFLSSNAVARFETSAAGIWLKQHGGITSYSRMIFLGFVLISALLSYQHAHTPFTIPLPYGNFLIDLMWWIYAIPLMLFVVLYGRTVEARPTPFLHSRVRIANLATVLLMLNSTSAYIGLNANADLAMFSNLRTEWGESNHYIVTPPPYLFSYLDREHYVNLISSTHPYLQRKFDDNEYIHKNKIRRFFEKKRYDDNGAPYSVKIKYSDTKIETVLSNQPNHGLTRLPSFIERNYLRFGIFNSSSPRPCSAR